jgi:fido (protein-threonine AMPylation protein)
VARRGRQTRPLDAKVGRLETYEEQEPLLVEAEWRGRRWAFGQAGSKRPLTDEVILELHAQMFEPLFDWAGQPRTTAIGPGGVEHVPAHQVRAELRKLGDDFAAWLAAAGTDPSVEEIASILARAHHRFQWVHPFQDTNGRTGRVLDHYVLWVSFGLASRSLETSPVLVYFPDDAREDAYYDGLAAADNHRSEPLTEFYLQRLELALRPVFTVHWWDGSRTTTCVAIHENADAAAEDALARSKEDPVHLFRVLGAEARVVLQALGGRFVDQDGNPIQRVPREE